jgi:glutamate/tyrosine decarboxylase-like PLP-dependent enzyme
MEKKSDSSPLELSPDQMRDLGYRAVDFLVERHVELRDQPVIRSATRTTAEELLREPLPEHESDPALVLEQVQRDVFGYIASLTHPRFFAFVPSPSNWVSVLAEMLVAGVNPFLGSWLVSPGPSQVELITIDWLRQLCGLPEGTAGLFVSGGSVATLTALAVARHTVLADRIADATVYFSDQTHTAVERALSVLGFGRDQFRALPTDQHFRLELDALRLALERDRANGKHPFSVVANAGTTNTGAVDPLPELVDLCRDQGLWLHVDGAYGAAAVLTEAGSALLKGIEGADSLVLDPHKWLFQPFEIGCVLVREGKQLPKTFAVHPEYLRDVDWQEEDVNFRDYGIQLTRSFRALKLWLSLKVFGLAAFREAIGRGIELAEQAEAMLRSSGRWEVVTSAQLGIVTFRWAGAGDIHEEIDRINQRIVEGMIAEGFAFLTSTVLRGRVVLRLCTINPRTTEEDLAETIRHMEVLADRDAGP